MSKSHLKTVDLVAVTEARSVKNTLLFKVEQKRKKKEKDFKPITHSLMQ